MAQQPILNFSTAAVSSFVFQVTFLFKAQFHDKFCWPYHFRKIPIHRYQAKAEGKVRLATGQALACAPEREVN